MSVKGMTTEGVFSGRLLAIWISASVALLAASLYFMLMPEGTSPGTDSVGAAASSGTANAQATAPAGGIGRPPTTHQSDSDAHAGI